MYLNTLGKHELYQSLAEIMDTTKDRIEKYIFENKTAIVECHYDEYSIKNLNLGNLLEQVGGKKINLIDDITVHHISPRKNVDYVYKEGILTLPHVLTQNTELAEYLMKFGFSFEFVDKQIIMKKDGRNIENLDSASLKMRFGGEGTTNDFNVNGYLFVDNFDVHAVRGWLGSPEILKSIAQGYRRYDIADNYAKNCKNYLISFTVPLDKVDLEGVSDKIDCLCKTEYLVKFAVMALAYFEIKRKTIWPMYNPIIMLKRDYDVPGEDICKIWTFDYERNKIIPKALED